MLTEWLPPFAPSGLPTLAHAPGAKLRDDLRLLKLTHGTEDLADQHARSVFVGRGQVADDMRVVRIHRKGSTARIEACPREVK